MKDPLPTDPKLSKVMKLLVADLREHGLVKRFLGGFWCTGEFSRSGSYGASTVEALVTRNVAYYTDWKDGKAGRFPIEAQLLPEWETLGRYA